MAVQDIYSKIADRLISLDKDLAAKLFPKPKPPPPSGGTPFLDAVMQKQAAEKPIERGPAITPSPYGNRPTMPLAPGRTIIAPSTAPPPIRRGPPSTERFWGESEGFAPSNVIPPGVRNVTPSGIPVISPALRLAGQLAEPFMQVGQTGLAQAFNLAKGAGPIVLAPGMAGYEQQQAELAARTGPLGYMAGTAAFDPTMLPFLPGVAIGAAKLAGRAGKGFLKAGAETMIRETGGGVPQRVIAAKVGKGKIVFRPTLEAQLAKLQTPGGRLTDARVRKVRELQQQLLELDTKATRAKPMPKVESISAEDQAVADINVLYNKVQTKDELTFAIDDEIKGLQSELSARSAPFHAKMKPQAGTRGIPSADVETRLNVFTSFKETLPEVDIPVRTIGAGQTGMGIGEKPAQGQLLAEFQGAGQRAPLADAEQIALRQARQAEIARGQAAMPEPPLAARAVPAPAAEAVKPVIVQTMRGSTAKYEAEAIASDLTDKTGRLHMSRRRKEGMRLVYDVEDTGSVMPAKAQPLVAEAAPAAQAAKEPWQMTRDEYKVTNRQAQRLYSDVVSQSPDYYLRFDNATYSIGDKLPPSRKWKDGDPVPFTYKGTSAFNPRVEIPRSEGDSVYTYTGNVYLVRGKVIRKGVDTGEVLLQNPEVVRILRPSQEMVIRQALTEGKPVPASVLAEHPDLAAAPVPGQAPPVVPPAVTRAVTPPPDDVIKRFTTFIHSPESLNVAELTVQMRTKQLGQRVARLQERTDELLAKGMKFDVALKQAEKETMSGKFEHPVATLAETMADEVRDAAFAKVYEVLKNEPLEQMSTAEALTNALLGKGIPRTLGTKGGSAYTRLSRIFPPEVIEALEKGKPLAQTLEDTLLSRPIPDITWPKYPEPWLAGEQMGLRQGLGMPQPKPSIAPPGVGEVERQLSIADFKAELEGRIRPSPDIAEAMAQPEIVSALQGSLMPLQTRHIVVRTLKEIGLTIQDIGNLLRANRSSFDQSFGRQVGTLIPSYPDVYLRNYVKAWAATFKPSVAELEAARIHKLPVYSVYEQLGIDVERMLNPPKGQVLRGEEAFGYFAGGKRPIQRLTGKIPWVNPSNRGFVTGLNGMVMDISQMHYDNMLSLNELYASGAKKLPEGGFSISKQMLDFGHMLEDFSGRGRLGPAKDLAPTLNAFFWSLRLNVGRALTPRHLISPNPIVRKAAWKILGKFAATVVGVETLGEVAGWWEIGKSGHTKGKIRLGNTWIDPWAGFQQFFRYSEEMITGTSTSAQTGTPYKIDRVQHTKRFLLSKAAPLVGLARLAVTRKTYAGEAVDYENLRQWFDELAPLASTDVVEAFRESGFLVGAISIPLSISGMGLVSYKQADLAAESMDKFKEYNAIPTSDIELAKLRRDNPSKTIPNREGYKATHPDIDALLFVLGEVDTIKAGSIYETLNLIEERKINPDDIRGIQLNKANTAKWTKEGIKDPSKITPTDRLVRLLAEAITSQPAALEDWQKPGYTPYYLQGQAPVAPTAPAPVVSGTKPKPTWDKVTGLMDNAPPNTLRGPVPEVRQQIGVIHLPELLAITREGGLPAWNAFNKVWYQGGTLTPEEERVLMSLFQKYPLGQTNFKTWYKQTVRQLWQRTSEEWTKEYTKSPSAVGIK